MCKSGMDNLKGIFLFIIMALSVDTYSKQIPLEILVTIDSVVINGHRVKDIEKNLKKDVLSGAQTVTVRACHEAPIELLQSVTSLSQQVGYKTIKLEAIQC